MGKPRVQVTVPAPLVIGGDAVVDLEIEVDAPLRVNEVVAHLWVRQGWSLSEGSSSVGFDRDRELRRWRLCGEGALAPGRPLVSRIAFPLSVELAPSHRFPFARAALRLTVELDLPWALDRRHDFALEARAPVPSPVPRTPVIVHSADRREGADAPRIELSLASSTIIAGEVLVGSIALYHLDDRRAVDLTFVPHLRLFGAGAPRPWRAPGRAFRIALPADHGGKAVPFTIALPADLPPTFRSRTHALDWEVVASTGGLLVSEHALRHPVVVLDRAASATAAPLVTPPRLGEDRVATLFAAAAARAGWRVMPPAADEPIAIARGYAGGELRLAYDYRGDAGTFVVARVEHRPLGLGLSVVPSTLVHHLFWHDVEVGLAAWDRAHRVEVRDPAQAVPFLREVVPQLDEAGDLGRLRSWDDRVLVLERAAGVAADGDLAASMAALARLADGIVAARARIAPPAAAPADLAAWRGLATWLEGDLCPGDLSVRGALDGRPVTLELARSGGRPTRLVATVGSPATASEAARAVVLTLDQPLADVLAAGTPEPVVLAVAAWPTDVRHVAVADGVATGQVALAGEGTAPVALDPAGARALVLALRGLLTALEPATTPYR